MMKSKEDKMITDISVRDLLPFLAMTFLIAWGILALYISAPAPTIRVFGEMTWNHPLSILPSTRRPSRPWS